METVKIEYQIPESKADITLQQWLDWEKVIEANKYDLDSLFVLQKQIEIFCGVPFEYVTKLKQVEIDEMIGYIHIVFNQKSEFIKQFEFEGVEYGFIPDYDKDITPAEHWDLTTYSQSKDWARVLSILYRPITKKIGNSYQIESYSGSHLRFMNLRYDVFDGMIGFFLRVFQELQKHTLLFTQKELMKMKKMNMELHCQDLVEKINSLTSMEFSQSWFT